MARNVSPASAAAPRIAPTPRSRTLALPTLLILACAAGGLVGLGARASDYGPSVAHWVGALGAPWLLASFAAGAFARGRRSAATAGAVAIVAGVVAYYISMWRIEQRTGEEYATLMIVGWSLAGVLVGAPFGVAGFMARSRRERVASWGLAALVAALLAEAAYVSLVWQSAFAQALATAEVVAAFLLVAASRRGPRVATFALPLAALMLVGELAVTTVMRGVGWAGT